jgi:hypothetical protein
MMTTIRPSSDAILSLARQARRSQPSTSLDKLILNVALGARPCWHQRLRALLIDPPGDNPLGDDEGDSLPSRALLGARLAIARRALRLEAL